MPTSPTTPWQELPAYEGERFHERTLAPLRAAELDPAFGIAAGLSYPLAKDLEGIYSHPQRLSAPGAGEGELAAPSQLAESPGRRVSVCWSRIQGSKVSIWSQPRIALRDPESVVQSRTASSPGLVARGHPNRR